MKIAIVSDTHWGARGNSQFFLDYFSKFYNEVFFPEIKKRKITHIIHLGDVFDVRKGINFKTLNTFNNVFIKGINENNLSADIIAGNHDTFFKSTNEINSLTELIGNQHKKINVFHEPVIRNYDGTEVTLMPWISTDNYVESIQIIKEQKTQYLFGHFEIDGFIMTGTFHSKNDFKKRDFLKYEQVLSGHFHDRQTQDNITYVGSPYEITWNDYEKARGFHIWDSDTGSLEFIENPLRMFHKVLYTPEMPIKQDLSFVKDSYIKVIVQEKSNPTSFDLFMDKLYNNNPAWCMIVDDNKNMGELSEEELMDSSEDTISIIRKTVDKTSMNVDKNELFNFMNDLYDKAMTSEEI